MLDLLLPFLAGAFSVFATVETAPSPYPEDSIDDTAIWYNQHNPEASLIFATLKASNQRPVLPTGILVYNLEGEQLQFAQGGTPNNIDIRQRKNGDAVLAVSHWYSDTIQIYLLDEHQYPKHLSTFETGMKKLRGTCLFESDSALEYFAVSEAGKIQQYRLSGDYRQAELLREFPLNSGAEGCVVDDENQTLFFAEENFGIWKIDANSDSQTEKSLIAKTQLFGPLKKDIEGLTLAKVGAGGYLIASSQGNSKFVVFDRISHKRLGSFRIRRSMNIDGTSQTDGISVITRPLGEAFPNGVFIAHDDANLDENNKTAFQNFKLVPWQQIQSRLPEPAKAP